MQGHRILASIAPSYSNTQATPPYMPRSSKATPPYMPRSSKSTPPYMPRSSKATPPYRSSKSTPVVASSSLWVSFTFDQWNQLSTVVTHFE